MSRKVPGNHLFLAGVVAALGLFACDSADTICTDVHPLYCETAEACHLVEVAGDDEEDARDAAYGVCDELGGTVIEMQDGDCLQGLELHEFAYSCRLPVATDCGPDELRSHFPGRSDDEARSLCEAAGGDFATPTSGEES